jgi:hypothetical protein
MFQDGISTEEDHAKQVSIIYSRSTHHHRSGV